MTKTEHYILQRLDNLERAFLQAQSNALKTTTKADYVPVVSVRVNDVEEEVKANAEAIEETNIGLMETYEETANNAVSIDELELALEEVYEMIM